MSLDDEQLIEPLPDEPFVPCDVGEVLLGKYRIGAIVGFGGMATVAAAHHLELDQPIAIKFLHPEQAARPEAVRRFLSEARAAARLNSPNIARVLDVGTAPTARGGLVPFMVMELLKGADLDAITMQRGRLPVAEAVEYLLQACAAIAEAHALGIIHRDLKPANLFLTLRRDGSPLLKLLDFGISKNLARKTGRKEAALTADREMMGTPRYMSPEQVRSAKDVDARTDIWSLGVILYELLTGTPPFEDENVADTFVKILHAAPESLLKRAPEVPAELVEVIMRCLQKKRENRYDNVEAFAAALAPYRSATPLVVPAIEVRSGDELPMHDAVSVLTVHDLPKRRIFRTVAVTFAAVGLLLIGAVGIRKLATTQSGAASAQTSANSLPPAAEDTAPALVPAPDPATSTETAATGSATSIPAAPEDTAADPKPAAAPPVKTGRPAGGTRPTWPSIKPPPPPPPRPPASAGPRSRTTW